MEIEKEQLNSIEPLGCDLLAHTEKLKLISHWAKVLNWPNGWHYDLDITWTLLQLDRLLLGRNKKEITILDAGGGLGLTQFILASLGFNVISLDFTMRKNPRLAKGIFSIKSDQEKLKVESHPYQKTMTYGQDLTAHTFFKRLTRQKLATALTHWSKTFDWLRNVLYNRENPAHIIEKIRNHSEFGKITFLRGSFNEIPLEDHAVDCLVSISAFEHNTYEDMPGSVTEFQRVTKPGGYLLVTTSLAKNKDWFFEPSLGWNLTPESLGNWFGIEPKIKNDDFDFYMNEIRASRALAKRIPSLYRYNSRCGLPFGKLNEAQYIPVGVRKCLI